MLDTDQEQKEEVELANLVVMIANHLASETFDSSSLNSLSRLDVENPGINAEFQRIRTRFDMWFIDEEHEKNWASILSGMALMTKFSPQGRRHRYRKKNCHNGSFSLGWTLFYAGDRRRTNGYYRENMLGKLLTSRGKSRRSLLGKMYRMFSTRDCSLNWIEIAAFILTRNAAARKRRLKKIAQDYYTAEASLLH